MNPIAKHYMRLRFQKRVAALKRAGIAVTHKNVYSEHVQVGVPVPRFGTAKRSGRRQYNYAESRTRFVIEFVVTGVAAIVRRVLHPRSKNVFLDHGAGDA
jgi:hypothetical protein